MEMECKRRHGQVHIPFPHSFQLFALRSPHLPYLAFTKTGFLDGQ